MLCVVFFFFFPTVLECCILHSVSAVSLISDVAVSIGARRTDDVYFHMISSNLVEGSGINDEVGCDFSKDPLK